MPLASMPDIVHLVDMPVEIDLDEWRLWTRQPGSSDYVHVEPAPSDVPSPAKPIAELPARYPDIAPAPDREDSVVRLRDYQRDAVEAVTGAWRRGVRAPLVVIGTAGGKTIIAAELIHRVHRRTSGKCLFLAHREELLDQTAEKVRLVSPHTRVGIVQSERNELGREVTIASIQTLAHHTGKRLAALLENGPYKMLVWDECHHAVSSSWESILDRIRERNPDLLVLGLTATPGRADGTALDIVFDEVVYERNIIQLIDDGWLVPPHAFKVTLDLDLDQVEVDESGDYVKTQLSKLMNQPAVNAAVVRAWQQYGMDRKMFVFAVDIAHSEALAQMFRDAGYTAEVISSRTKNRDRKAILKRFREGATKLLVNCNVVSEGFDEPSAEGILFARPTQSQLWYLQALGRSLRTYPGKTEAIIIDCVGNSDRHAPVQLASLAGFEPEDRLEGEEREGVTVSEEGTETPEVLDADIRGEEVNILRRMARARYQWRETSLGWVLQIPKIGYYLVAWHSQAHDKATVRFYDHRPNKRHGPPRAVVHTPVDFELAYSLVESEMERIFHARQRRQTEPEGEDDATDRESSFLDIDEGVDEDTYVPEAMMLREARWRDKPITAAQRELLLKLGVKERTIPSTAGEASDLITIMRVERDMKMRLPATEKQLRYLRLFGLGITEDMTKGEAARVIWQHRKQSS